MERNYMMLEQLKKQFKDAIVIDVAPHHDGRYKWYMTEDQTVIGIDHTVLTERECELFNIFLTPIHHTYSIMNKNQQQWYDLLFSNRPISTDLSFQSVRFIHFFLLTVFEERSAFNEACEGLFSTHFTIIWNTDQSGIIILEDESLYDGREVFSHIIETLMTDFYIDMYLFVGQAREGSDISTIKKNYKWEQSSWLAILKYVHKNRVYFMEDIVPFLLFDELSDETRHQLTSSLLESVMEDEELLYTIKIFLECNSNITLAAKKLYIHRNSLQYRLDKFIDKTGMNVKEFKGALAAYLAIIHLQTNSAQKKD